MGKRLNVEQILCLQWLGVKASEIFRANENFFNNIAKERDDLEELLNKAKSRIKEQERLGICSFPFHHPDFPQCLRVIGEDCPLLIHLLGNMDLLDRKAVAIIGARKAGEKGCYIENKFNLSKLDYLIKMIINIL